MEYTCPGYADLGAVGDSMNPLFVDQAVALGPTRVMAAPDAGYAYVPQTALSGRHYAGNWFEPGYFELSGRHYQQNYFEPGYFELSGRQFDRNFFEPGTWELSGVREAMDVFTAAAFLFPE